MASDAGNFWENIGRFRTFPYFHSIIFVVNYKMNIISSHKMYIILPSVTRAAIRGWFWVSGCSSDISRCISDTDTGIQVTACAAKLRHIRGHIAVAECGGASAPTSDHGELWLSFASLLYTHFSSPSPTSPGPDLILIDKGRTTNSKVTVEMLSHQNIGI